MLSPDQPGSEPAGDQPRRVSDSTAALIARQIESGELQPGQRLLPERQLANDLGVSRTAIREAFKQLQALGLVEAHVGRGRFVTAGAEDKRSHFLAGQLFELHMNEIGELSEVRELLESAAVRSLSPTACPQIVEALQEILARAHQALDSDDLSLVARLDSDFHTVPIDHCANRALRVLAIGVMVAMGDTVRSVLADRPTAVASLVEHSRIVRAFEERDPELAAAIIGHHQITSYRRSLNALASDMLAHETVTSGSASVR